MLNIINANKIAMEIGMGRRTNTILQSAFFALNPQILPIDKAVEYMKEMAKKSYSKKGDAIVQLNYKAIDAGKDAIEEVTVDPKWADLEIQETKKLTGDDHFDNFVSVINALDGNDLPVSAFMDKLDGSMKSGMAYMEKRGIATMVPQWNKDDCIQCNNCVMVCPHATIRAFLMTDEEIANAPEDISNDVLKPMGKGVDGLSYRIQVSPDNCVGCGLCVEQCLGNKKGEALKMVNVHEELEHAPLADYIYKEVEYRDDKYPTTTVKGVKYAVTKSAAKGGTAEAVKVTGKGKKITIAATVKIDGVTFKVTSIKKNAAKKNKNMTSVVIGKNVTSIGANSFANSKKLANVTFKGTKAVKVGSKAFKGTSAKMKVVIPKKMSKKTLNTLKRNLKKAVCKKNKSERKQHQQT